MHLYGFSLIRNGVKYDYAFQEAFKSMAPIVEKLYLAVGKSDDGTEEVASKLPKVVIIPTVWDEGLRNGGLILSQQTNVALKALRSAVPEGDAWGLYLQGDECIHEADYERIVSDIEKAHEWGCDAVRFRYLHFWEHHHQVAINKKWYPQEIRAVKLRSKIESWGDAQSFRNYERIYESDATIYHYGHVRNQASYLKKKADFLKLYHWEERLPKYQRRERRYDSITETLPYLGRHPAIMRERITRLGDHWSFPKRDKVFIVGDKSDFDPKLLNNINVKHVYWAQNAQEVRHIPKEQKIFFRAKNPSNRFGVPTQARSKLARPWTKDFCLQVQLFCKGYSLGQLF